MSAQFKEAWQESEQVQRCIATRSPESQARIRAIAEDMRRRLHAANDTDVELALILVLAERFERPA